MLITLIAKIKTYDYGIVNNNIGCGIKIVFSVETHFLLFKMHQVKKFKIFNFRRILLIFEIIVVFLF